MIRTSLLQVFALTIVGASAAAGQTQIAGPSGLSAGSAVFTNPDAVGTTFTGSKTYAATGLDVTFASVGDTLEVDKVGQNYFGSAFPGGTVVTYAGGFSGPQAPLTLLFSRPVSEFGFSAEDFTVLATTFSFQLFNGASQIGTFSAAGMNPGDADDPGMLAFVGARADAITSVVISDDVGNNIGVGPISYQLAASTPGTTVPEPTTVALAGAGLVGLGLARRFRPARTA